MGAAIPAVFLLEDWTSPRWRLEHLYWILDENGKPVLFQLRPEQDEFISNLWNWNVIPKSRRIGFSTVITLIQFDSCLFNDNFTAATICDTLDNAKKIFRKNVDYTWSRLPQTLCSHIGVKAKTTEEIWLGNNSGLSISVSARSQSLQSLHISEYGKICAKYPEKAKEIKSGSIAAVVKGGMIYIESTGEGSEGDFHDIVLAAKQRQDQGTKETVLDFRLHFFPWWRKPENSLDPVGIVIPKEMRDYFSVLLKKHGIALSPRQMAWYVKMAETYQNLMKREYPSILSECFEGFTEGSIYQNEMTILRKNGKIGTFPWDPRRPVNTFWDFGVDDATTCWFHQRIDGRNRLIGYAEESNKGVGWWVNKLNSVPYTYGRHYMPHDVNMRMQGEVVENRYQIFQRLGIYNIKPVKRVRNLSGPQLNSGIEQLRQFLLTCEFDEEGCVDGIKALDHYRREWDEKLGKFSDAVLRNFATHGTDALRQGAQGYEPDHEFAGMGYAPYQESSAILIPEVGY